MAQEKVWEREYRNSKLLVKENIPQADVVRFVKFLKKEEKRNIEDMFVLDLGSGTGRNSFYFAELGAYVTGFEISHTALEIAKYYSREHKVSVLYKKQNIGETFPCDNNSFDIVLDITSSNSLNEKEREVYLKETHRVLKDDGYFFVKALCKDGDENAKYLLKNSPGQEVDTYIMPETEIVERVWSKEDFMKTYGTYFTIIRMEKKTTYTRMNNRSYKRNFWIVYMKKI